MFLLTWGFRFLDIINYLGPGTSYKKWVKAYGCKTVKSWFLYEWFNPRKDLFPGASRLSRVVFEVEGSLRSHAG